MCHKQPVLGYFEFKFSCFKSGKTYSIRNMRYPKNSNCDGEVVQVEPTYKFDSKTCSIYGDDKNILTILTNDYLNSDDYKKYVCNP